MDYFWNINNFTIAGNTVNYLEDALPYFFNYDQNRQVNDMKWFVLLAYTAIFRPNDLLNLEQKINNILLQAQNAAVAVAAIVANIQNIRTSLATEFPQKWLKAYKYDKKDVGSWIIAMWCDMHCKFSQSNLKCRIHFRLLALAAGLNLGEDKIQGVINVYKPHLINLIPNQNIAIQKITKWIMLLLNNYINKYNIIN